MQCSICKKSNQDVEYLFSCMSCPSMQFCSICNQKKHLNQHHSHIKDLFIYCQECESQPDFSTIYCSACEQNLCKNCDLKIHNKGKRARHKRSILILQQEFSVTDIVIINHKDINIITDNKHVIEELKKQIPSNRDCYIINGEGESYNELAKCLSFSKVEELPKGFNIEQLKEKIVFKQNVQIIYLLYFGDNMVRVKQMIDKIANDEEIIKKQERLEINLEKIYLQKQFLDSKSEEECKFDSQSKNKLESINNSNSSSDSAIITHKIQASSYNTHHNILNSPIDQYYTNKQKIMKNSSLKDIKLSNQLDQAIEIIDSSDENSLLNDENVPILSSQQLQTKKESDTIQIYHNTHSCSMPFMLYQNFKRISLQDSLKSSYAVQKELFRLADIGQLMINSQQFLQIMENIFPKVKDMKIMQHFLQEAIDQGIVHKTERLFQNNNKFEMVSLQLEYLSLQSLVWTIKSIKVDLMTPTEKLILCRIKECFALKLTPKSWEMILQHLQHPNYLEKAKDNQLPMLVFKKSKDPLQGSEQNLTTIIYIEGDEWMAEDVCDQQQDQEIEKSKQWLSFLEFLQDYFNSPKDDTNSQIQRTIKKTKVIKKKQQSESFKDNIKAIPGGRYGCSQYIKYCGCPILQQCSLGRLQLFVQKAINKGIIRHYRTLLVKNESDLSQVSINTSVFTQENSIPFIERSVYMLQKEFKIQQLQSALLEILKENPQGVSLAQIPQFLKKKVYFQINLQELGFPKLKNFINTLADIQIELAGTNNSFAKLKSTKKSLKKINADAPLYIPPSHNDQHVLSNPFFQIFIQEQQDNKVNNLPAQTQLNKQRIQNLNQNQYSKKVFDYIDEILKNNQFGIRIDNLYYCLNKKLGFEFDYYLFQCMDFYGFLTMYCENILDIECKKNTFFIYQKNIRFQQNAAQLDRNNIQQLGGMHKGKMLQPYESEKDELKQQKLVGSSSATNLGNIPWNNQQLFQLYQNNQINSTQNNYFHDMLNLQSEPDNTELSRNISWNQQDVPNPFHTFYGPIQSQQENKPNKGSMIPEDSNIELKEHLKFIEDFLENDNNETVSFRTNYTVDRTFEQDKSHLQPQLGLSSIQAYSQQALSEDFINFSQQSNLKCDSNKKNVLSNHNRATSTVEKNTYKQ